MKFIDFFAGVGGFRHGLELAGHKCVGFCEWDKFAAASYTSMHLITDEQRKYLSSLTLKQRQKEILKDEYRNGEWYASDIRAVDARSLPTADCWCFGAPCQDFSIAGKRAGLDGDRSSLIREIFRLLEEQEEQDRPEWLIYENVKGMLSSNRGLDYLSILSEMDRLGYDIEWQNINSKWFVPQNRERIYTIGHLRRFGSAKILPVEGADGKGCVQQLGNYMSTKTRENPNQGRIYSIDGISPYLNKMDGGGREPSTGIKVIGSTKPQLHSLENIYAEDRHGVMVEPIAGVYAFNSKQFGSPIMDACIKTLKSEKHDSSVVLKINQQVSDVDDMEGIYVQLPDGIICYCIWYEKEQCYITIRKLTPKECFRLQGWTDDYFEKAAFINSDSQLYKQAGNGVTVDVVKAIGDKIKEYEKQRIPHNPRHETAEQAGHRHKEQTRIGI